MAGLISNFTVDEINRVGKDIVEQMKAYKNPRILESQFRDIVLPSFMKNLGKPVEEHELDGFNFYINIVRSEYTRVDCYSDTTGELLFWIPPLRYHSDLTDIDMVAMHKKATAYKKRSPTIYAQIIHNTLTEATSSVTIPDEDYKQWELIKKRYGYASKAEGELAKPSGVESNKTGNDNDSLEFEVEEW